MLFNQPGRVSEFDSFQREYKVCSLSLRWGCWPILWRNCGAELQKWENAASSHFLALLEKMWLIKLTPDQSPWQNVSGGLTQFSSQLVHSHVIHKRETPINKQSHTAAGLWIQHHTTMLWNNSPFYVFLRPLNKHQAANDKIFVWSHMLSYKFHDSHSTSHFFSIYHWALCYFNQIVSLTA